MDHRNGFDAILAEYSLAHEINVLALLADCAGALISVAISQIHTHVLTFNLVALLHLFIYETLYEYIIYTNNAKIAKTTLNIN